MRKYYIYIDNMENNAEKTVYRVFRCADAEKEAARVRAAYAVKSGFLLVQEYRLYTSSL